MLVYVPVHKEHLETLQLIAVFEYVQMTGMHKIQLKLVSGFVQSIPMALKPTLITLLNSVLQSVHILYSAKILLILASRLAPMFRINTAISEEEYVLILPTASNFQILFTMLIPKLKLVYRNARKTCGQILI